MQPAKPIIVDSMRRLNPNLVLDLGCGLCKFSRRLLSKGANVVGVDKDPVIESCGNFTFIQQDILDFHFEPKYNLMIGSGILHYLKNKDAYWLIKKMQKNTLFEGFHFLICMSDKELDSNIYFYPNRKILNKLYSDWEIIHNVSCLSKEHGSPAHQHKMIVFLARKIIAHKIG
jgi:16S rRNA A1518/A1519 N6-dimethyltransferase RsmA/KsgA/DIM1 with predicted DNA glycosylase/AP lyase activity